jgi:hypothetical protein
MLIKLLRSIIHAVKGDRGKVCPRCKSTETEDYGPLLALLQVRL